MSFVLKERESLQKGLRRIVCKQLSSALDRCRDTKAESIDERIHEVRKSCKRIRAVLRLVRFSIGDSSYHFENEALRDAARPLSSLRDAKVLIETLDELKDDRATALDDVPYVTCREILVDRHSALLAEDGNAFSQTRRSLQDSLERINDWTDPAPSRKELSKGIKRVYRAGRTALSDSKVDMTSINLHELRKQVKYLRYHLELLSPIGEDFPMLAKAAEGSGEVLGKDHDLGVLRLVLQDCGTDDNAAERNAICEIAFQQSDTLQSDAILLADALYAERPAQFVDRFNVLFRRWSKKSA